MDKRCVGGGIKSKPTCTRKQDLNILNSTTSTTFQITARSNQTWSSSHWQPARLAPLFCPLKSQPTALRKSSACTSTLQSLTQSPSSVVLRQTWSFQAATHTMALAVITHSIPGRPGSASRVAVRPSNGCLNTTATASSITSVPSETSLDRVSDTTVAMLARNGSLSMSITIRSRWWRSKQWAGVELFFSSFHIALSNNSNHISNLNSKIMLVSCLWNVFGIIIDASRSAQVIHALFFAFPSRTWPLVVLYKVEFIDWTFATISMCSTVCVSIADGVAVRLSLSISGVAESGNPGQQTRRNFNCQIYRMD